MTERYLFNRDNLLNGQQLTADNVIASNAIRRESAIRTGGGFVALQGPYTGQHDASVELEVLNNTINGAPRISSPQFTGVGNDSIGDISASAGVAAQVVTVTLEDLGIDTLAAYADIANAQIVARTPGAGGNQLTISINAGGLTLVASNYSTPEDLRTGDVERSGNEWNFGHSVLLGNGTVPDDAPRVSFGSDPQVYRLFKVFADGEYLYRFSPAIRRDVPADTTVFVVSGSRTCRVTDLAAPLAAETFAGIVTRYDLLSALNNSTQVMVDGVIANDKLPGGAGCDDLNLFTSAYIQSQQSDGTQFIRDALIPIGVDAGSATERLTLQCSNADEVGEEIWQVRGARSGDLPRAITGLLYQQGGYDFTIPIQLPDDRPPGGRIDLEKQEQARGPQEIRPGICFVRPVLGARAVTKDYTFTWRLRPAGECDCDDAPFSGGPDPDCLGIDDIEDIIMAGDLPSRVLKRLSDLQDWLRASIRSNTGFGGSDVLDITLFELAAGHLAAGLTQSFSNGTLVYPDFENDATYSLGDVIQAGGYRHEVTVAGGAGSSAPTWDLTEGNTTLSGAVTFENIGKTAYGVWDVGFSELQADFNQIQKLTGTTPGVLVNGSPHLVPIINLLNVAERGRTAAQTVSDGMYVHPSSAADGVISYVTGAGDDIVPFPSTLGEHGQSSDASFTVWGVYEYWRASQVYDLGHIVAPGNGYFYEVTTAGTSDTTIPNYNLASPSYTDGGVVWTRIDSPTLILNNQDVANFAKRYDQTGRSVQAAAGINPFDNASTADLTGGLCWQDYGDAGWWESEDGLLPLFNGHYYHSARLVFDDDDGFEKVTPTFEFGFGVKVGCVDKLKVGDKLIVKVSGVTNPYQTYQVGDSISAQVVAASPLQLGGGQDGDDTLIWRVVGSALGQLADYNLALNSPIAYNNGGLSFAITPGDLPRNAGDRFSFALEGGQFRWRYKDTAWSSALDIDDTVSLDDGLSAVFLTGSAPSFVAGDTYLFAALAINGADNVCGTSDNYLRTSAAGVVILPGGLADTLAIIDHNLEAGDTLTLQGSDDDFSTIGVQVVVPVNQRHTHIHFTQATHSSWRLVTPSAFYAMFIWLGAAPRFDDINGHVGEPYVGMSKNWRINTLGADNGRSAGAFAGLGLGIKASLTWLSNDDLLWLVDRLADSAEHHDGRMLFVPDHERIEVTMGIGGIGDIAEESQFLRSTDDRYRQSIDFELQPIAFD